MDFHQRVRRNDHKVDYRSFSRISEFAERIRKWAGVDHLTKFDITRVVERLTQERLGHKGALAIRWLSDAESYRKAYVSFSPLTLHIAKEWWDRAKLGDQEAVWIIAHELGHIFLHDSCAQAFSSDPSLHIKFAEQEYSAEWQADTFAYLLLIPSRLARQFATPDEISEAFNVEYKIALSRTQLEDLADAHRRSSQIGDSCDECGNFTLVRNRTCLKCDTCGSTTGCS